MIRYLISLICGPRSLAMKLTNSIDDGLRSLLSVFTPMERNSIASLPSSSGSTIYILIEFPD